MLQQTSGGQVEQEEELTLTALPDVPLLRVLSLLSVKDLWAIGRVCTRLCELTRVHTSLWSGKKASFGPAIGSHEMVDLGQLLEATPPVRLRLKLAVDNISDDMKRVHSLHLSFSSACDELGSRARSLNLRIDCSVNDSDSGASVIRKLGALTRELIIESECIYLGEIFGSLKNATSLETLVLECLADDDMVLPPLKCFQASPNLHTVEINVFTLNESSSYLDLRLFAHLLKAHREQLRCVRLRSSEAAPLLKACPSGLHRLTVVAERGVLAKLERMRHLSELEVAGHFLSAPTELATLLRTWQGPPLRLTVSAQCDEKLVHALGAAVMPSVTHLELGSSENRKRITASGLRALPAALPALHGLQSLVLFTCDQLVPVLRQIASSPVLSLLFILSTFGDDPTSEPERDLVCRDLVLRNSTSLHVVTDNPLQDRLFILFGRHPEAGLESCSVCAEVPKKIKRKNCSIRYVFCGEQRD